MTEYDNEMLRIMDTAMAARERDATFRRFVDRAAAQGMRHLDHVHDEIEPRDVHHVAVAAAMAALQLSMESDVVLKQLTIERDYYKKLAEDTLRSIPLTPPYVGKV